MTRERVQAKASASWSKATGMLVYRADKTKD